jgi:hypothetical protein
MLPKIWNYWLNLENDPKEILMTCIQLPYQNLLIVYYNIKTIRVYIRETPYYLLKQISLCECRKDTERARIIVWAGSPTHIASHSPWGRSFVRRRDGDASPENALKKNRETKLRDGGSSPPPAPASRWPWQTPNLNQRPNQPVRAKPSVRPCGPGCPRRP